MREQLTARLTELNKQLEGGASYSQKLRTQLEALEAQILRIQGAKLLVEELLKGMPQEGCTTSENEDPQSK